MLFNQKEDGSCDICFSKEEIKIIKNHRKIHLSKEFLKHFSNHLVKICVEFNNNFDEKTKKLITEMNTEIKGTKPKKTKML